jgi:hypothetical protein
MGSPFTCTSAHSPPAAPSPRTVAPSPQHFFRSRNRPCRHHRPVAAYAVEQIGGQAADRLRWRRPAAIGRRRRLLTRRPAAAPANKPVAAPLSGSPTPLRPHTTFSHFFSRCRLASSPRPHRLLLRAPIRCRSHLLVRSAPASVATASAVVAYDVGWERLPRGSRMLAIGTGSAKASRATPPPKLQCRRPPSHFGGICGHLLPPPSLLLHARCKQEAVELQESEAVTRSPSTSPPSSIPTPRRLRLVQRWTSEAHVDVAPSRLI